MKKTLVLAVLFSAVFTTVKAQYPTVSTVDSLPEILLNWQNLAPDNTKVPGVATEKAYMELLAGKAAKKKIIVAVIDSGVDTDHEDLDGLIWINEDEIPNNGIDDDKNGYIDDIHGWNFLGATNGDLIVEESLEMTRVVRDYRAQFEGKTGADISEADKPMFKMYQKAVKEHAAMVETYTAQKKQMDGFLKNYDFSVKLLGIAIQNENFTDAELEAYKPTDADMIKAKGMVTFVRKQGLDKAFTEALDHFNLFLDYHLNLDFDGRKISGDDANDINDRAYGNNNVEGPEADHGTFVSSMIAANRTNSLGINGIADNVEIMALRAVPNGDEYDKDIALAIRYAVDNGAHIINMSFGKSYSPHKQWVDEAMKYASDNNVLLVHAAGNDSKDNDIDPSFPNDLTLKNESVATWLEVGANSNSGKKDLCGEFSNYGKTVVDVFAPGVQVIGCVPNDKYAVLDGTSFACPVTSGVAALVWSRYPELTALELKEILMESSYSYGKKKVRIPGEKKKTKFRELCISGGVVNAYNALEMAAKKS